MAYRYSTLMQHTKKLRIAVLSYRGLSGQGIEGALTYMFPAADIISIFPQHIRTPVLKTYDLLILPGINDEDSAYPTLLPSHKMNILQQAIEQDGLILWTFCAASYYMFEEISYQRRSGIFKQRKGAGLIKGVARHGFNHITRRELPADPWNDYILAGIRITGHDGVLRALNINGPTMEPDEGRESMTETFMRYTDIRGAAGLIKTIGRGLLIALGVHPELSPVHPRLPESFVAHDNDRFVMLDIIRDKIRSHLVRSTTTLPNDLSCRMTRP